MAKIAVISAILALLYSPWVFAEYRADFSSRNRAIAKTIYVPRSAPINSLLDTVDLGTYTAWTWWNVSGTTEVGIYLPGLTNNEVKIPSVGYVRELNNSGVGYTLYATVNEPCSGSGYIDGHNSKDGDPANKIICASTASSASYSVSIKAMFYKVSHNVTSSTLPNTKAAMLILYNNGFITLDSFNNREPYIHIGAVNIVSSGCDVKNNLIDIPFGKVDKSTFSGVGSTSSESKRQFQIDLDCDAKSPIKITFSGAVDPSGTPGTIAVNDPSDINTAKGYGIQVTYNHKPIKLNKLMNMVRSNKAGQYTIPLEASYIQTLATTTAGNANGTLQFNLQYH